MDEEKVKLKKIDIYSKEFLSILHLFIENLHLLPVRLHFFFFFHAMLDRTANSDLIRQNRCRDETFPRRGHKAA